MKRVIQVILVIIIPNILIFTFISFWNPDYYEGAQNVKDIKVEKKDYLPVDHSKYPELQKDFKTPQEVTEACLGCHNNIDDQLMKNEHWQWTKIDTIPGRGAVSLGKRNVLNNFCIGTGSNEKLCTMCHAGYDFKDNSFDKTHSQNMDCLVCHDATGSYHKSNTCADPSQRGFGYPPLNTDFKTIAQHVDLPSRHNCGSCHYVGGGGNNVKHGDLEMAQNKCTKDLDVHMAADGENMSCTECHKTHNHNIPGNLPMVSASPSNSFDCMECHSSTPHKSSILNKHNYQVACQTCHIPTYAKSAPTKLYWDWSAAGKLGANGGLLHFEKEIPKDSIQNYISNLTFLKTITSDSVIYEYDSRHAAAILAKNVRPEYVWSNGYTDHHFVTDTILKDTVNLTTLMGSYQDNINPEYPNHPSKIIPVKIMRGNQIYDTEYKKLINPKLVGIKGSGAYWRDFDWDSSAVKGMAYIGQKYSGHHGFIETKSY